MVVTMRVLKIAKNFVFEFSRQKLYTYQKMSHLNFHAQNSKNSGFQIFSRQNVRNRTFFFTFEGFSSNVMLFTFIYLLSGVEREQRDVTLFTHITLIRSST